VLAPRAGGAPHQVELRDKALAGEADLHVNLQFQAFAGRQLPVLVLEEEPGCLATRQ